MHRLQSEQDSKCRISYKGFLHGTFFAQGCWLAGTRVPTRQAAGGAQHAKVALAALVWLDLSQVLQVFLAVHVTQFCWHHGTCQSADGREAALPPLAAAAVGSGLSSSVGTPPVFPDRRKGPWPMSDPGFIAQIRRMHSGGAHAALLPCFWLPSQTPPSSFRCEALYSGHFTRIRPCVLCPYASPIPSPSPSSRPPLANMAKAKAAAKVSKKEAEALKKKQAAKVGLLQHSIGSCRPTCRSQSTLRAVGSLWHPNLARWERDGAHACAQGYAWKPAPF